MYSYGFWRHDSWFYTHSELSEFRNSGRWLAPIFYNLLHKIPPLYASIFTLILLYYVYYMFIKRFYQTLKVEHYLFAIFAFIPIVSPALFAQLTWPTHNLSASIILAIGAYLTRNKDSLFVLIIMTILTFSILQSFAFLTFLFAIPSMVILVKKSNVALIKQFLFMIIVWSLSILIAYLISKAIQYSYFGYLPGLPKWREANPANNITELIINILVNLELFIKYMDNYFYSFKSLMGIYFISVLGSSYLIKTGEKRGKALLYLIVTSITILILPYFIIAPVGTILFYRSIFMTGFSFLLLGIVFYFLIKYFLSNTYKITYPFILIITLLFILYQPYTITYYNTKWFKSKTSHVYNSLKELKPIHHIHGIIIDLKHNKSQYIWHEDFFSSLNGHPLVMEDLNDTYRLNTAFHQLGYDYKIGIKWCFPNTQNKYCSLLANMTYNKCASINKRICTDTQKSTHFWFLKF
jgi:hypothetical protein